MSLPEGLVGLGIHLFKVALALFGHNPVYVAFVGAFLETIIAVGAIVPGGSAVIFAGFAARDPNTPSVFVVAAAAWAGMTAGAALDYWIGRVAGKRLIPRRAPWRLYARWHRMLRRARRFLSRWGWWALLAANLAGPGRSAIAVAAGASEWRFPSFIAGQAIASLLWSALYCGIGFLAAGGERRLAAQLVSGAGVAMAILLVFALVAPAVISMIGRMIARRFRPPARQGGGARSRSGTVSALPPA